jgi:ABC-type protease/lipase transport system fused ATPase/permease subunit
MMMDSVFVLHFVRTFAGAIVIHVVVLLRDGITGKGMHFALILSFTCSNIVEHNFQNHRIVQTIVHLEALMKKQKQQTSKTSTIRSHAQGLL